MGQGLTTQIVQIASYVLNVPMEMIHVEGTRTSVLPNPTSTGGSTGTAYNGEAVKRTCQQFGLAADGFRLRNAEGAWAAIGAAPGHRFLELRRAGMGRRNSDRSKWQTGKETYLAEPGAAGLQQARGPDCQLHRAHPGRHDACAGNDIQGPKDQQEIPGIERSQSDPICGAVDSFIGFTYSGACSVVEVDILTGEVKMLSADIVYDMGWSLNPAIDIGQVEGAFIQGVGYLMTEKLVFEQEGPEKGRLNTVNTWRYKPPAITTIPLEMNVHLFPRDLAESVPKIPTICSHRKKWASRRWC